MLGLPFGHQICGLPQRPLRSNQLLILIFFHRQTQIFLKTHRHKEHSKAMLYITSPMHVMWKCNFKPRILSSVLVSNSQKLDEYGPRFISSHLVVRRPHRPASCRSPFLLLKYQLTAQTNRWHKTNENWSVLCEKIAGDHRRIRWMCPAAADAQ